MHKQSQTRKKNRGKRSRGRGRGRKANADSVALRKDRLLRFPVEIPPRMQVTVRSVINTTYFSTATSYGGIAIYMNGVVGFDGTLFTVYNYENLLFHMYNKVRVARSRIKIHCSSREATATQTLILAPCVGSAVPGTSASFNTLAALPHTKMITLAPIGSYPSSRPISHNFSPEVLVGRQYLEQDEYAGNPTTDPATLVYWMFAFCSQPTNTVTTGGINVIVELKTTFDLYELQRDSSITKEATSISEIDQKMNQLILARAQLLKTS